MTTYRVAQVDTAGGSFEIAERETTPPGPGHVRVSVDACGVCHSDSAFVNAAVPGVTFPVVPGHEIAGRVAVLGEGTEGRGWEVGDRVAVGWFGGACGYCTPCREGDFIVCENLKVPGWAYEGDTRSRSSSPWTPWPASPTRWRRRTPRRWPARE